MHVAKRMVYKKKNKGTNENIFKMQLKENEKTQRNERCKQSWGKVQGQDCIEDIFNVELLNKVQISLGTIMRRIFKRGHGRWYINTRKEMMRIFQE